jgi:hypothetical protein
LTVWSLMPPIDRAIAFMRTAGSELTRVS